MRTADNLHESQSLSFQFKDVCVCVCVTSNRCILFILINFLADFFAKLLELAELLGQFTGF